VYENGAVVLGCRDLNRELFGYSVEGIKNKTFKAGGNVIVLDRSLATFEHDVMWGPVPHGRVYDCRGAKPIDLPRDVTFSEREYAPYAENGTASVSGQAFLKTRGGEVRYAAGDDVFLDPATDYQMALYLKDSGGKFLDSNGDPVLNPVASKGWRKYRRTTIADAEGRFRFDKLPAGKYYVTSNVRWETGAGSTGGWVIRDVSISDGQQMSAIVATTTPPIEMLERLSGTPGKRD